MMTVNQITETLRCSRETALRILRNANLQPVKIPFSHGKKHFYKITTERLLEIRADQQKDPVKIAEQQADALSRIESVFKEKFNNKNN